MGDDWREADTKELPAMGGELSSRTKVGLGVVVALLMVVVSVVVWIVQRTDVSNLRAEVAVLNSRLTAQEQVLQAVKAANDRRFERIEDKLDKILEKVSNKQP